MMIENLVQYRHLEKLYGYLPGMDESLMTQLFGLGLEEYREIRGRFDANARDAALELLEEPGSPGASTGCRSGRGRPWWAWAAASRTTCNPGSRSFATCWSCGDPKAEYASSTPVYRRTRRPWCSVGLFLTVGPPRIGDATWRRRAGVWAPGHEDLYPRI
jgi:hypothetical protein